METTHVDVKELCVRSINIMADGTFEDFEAVVHPEARNREDVDEPPASRGRGPAAFYATALWLRDAYADLRWDVHDIVAEGDVVVLHATMSGRQTGTFVGYDENARPAQAFPPTGKRFATTQTHWFRIADGKVIEHWANRDDLGTATQLGWAPPSPLYMLRMLWRPAVRNGRPGDDPRLDGIAQVAGGEVLPRRRRTKGTRSTNIGAEAGMYEVRADAEQYP